MAFSSYMLPFDFNPRTRIVFGADSLNRLGELVAEYGGRRVLLVSDHGIADAGHVAHAEKLIRDSGIECYTFLEVEENPTTKHVANAVDFAREHRIDFIVGLGGGSSMDCAKGANFILTNGGRMQDYWGVDKATKPMLPMIAIPTTAGTGSEAQSFALIADEETHAKMACGDKKAACRVAILDPLLTLSMPREVAAITGIDAISHALESYVTKKRNPISQLFAREAWGLLSRNFPRVFENPADIDARGGMLLGACLAGLAIENSMLGATHSLANPLSAHHGTVHGRAIGMMLPHVIRKNAEVVGELYAELVADVTRNGVSAATAGAELSSMIESFLKIGGLPARLGESGIDRALLPQMAKEAAGQWTAQFNPRPLNEAEFLELYECAY